MKAIKNIAIIAHVDHGKTTLVDKILHHCNLFRSNESTGELILDNNDLERERGITILSKNVAVVYKDVKINMSVDESLIGGLVVKVGSRMIDTSIRAKLNSLQNSMKEVG